jgi:hypothetical protein
MPAIRVAIKTHKRPTAVILRDDWYGHRDPFSGAPEGDKDEWLDWDFALIDAFQTIEDYSDQYGLLQWELDDDDVVVDAIKKIHPFEQARDLATKGSKNKPYEPAPGEYFVPKMYKQFSDDPDFQTYEAWLKRKAEELEDE